MSLTKKETLLAAEVAAKYPPGNGESFISGRIMPHPHDVVAFLREHPEMQCFG